MPWVSISQPRKSFEALLLGFSLAGLLASAFELLTDRRASFRLLEGRGLATAAFVPVVIVSAPFIILRNALYGSRVGDRSSFFFVLVATIIAFLWSLASGKLVLKLALAVVGG